MKIVETGSARARANGARSARANRESFRVRAVTLWKIARPTLLFVSGWALLNTMLNLRYPAPEPALWYLVPSVDVLVVFLALALLGWGGFRVPKAVRVLVVVGFVLVRIIRLGDGVQQHYFAQPFNLYTDLPQLPELVRLGAASLPGWQFALGAAGFVALLALAAYGSYRALEYAEQYLIDARNTYVATAIAGAAFFAGSLFDHGHPYQELYWGGFGSSAMKRIRYEAKFIANVRGENAERARAILSVQEELAAIPHDLSGLGGANVHLVIFESYGEAVFERPELSEVVAPSVEAFERELGKRGFSFVTGLLDSPTYGGRSWLAHATIGTGVKTATQFQYDVLCAREPKTMARFFRDAGYRTVLVQPGTTREWPKGEFYSFEKKYYSWQFDYKGPSFAWATMPDQYVLDFIARQELASSRRRLFVQYTLVSSHAPWSDLPHVVEDWSKLRDGSLFNQLERTKFPIVWPHFENASEAYARSIAYDFEVTREFIARYVEDDALVIVLGDHQPVREITKDSPSHGVPVHVLSRNPALLEPFRARRFVAGMRPAVGSPRPGLERFLPSLLADFSTARARQ